MGIHHNTTPCQDHYKYDSIQLPECTSSHNGAPELSDQRNGGRCPCNSSVTKIYRVGHGIIEEVEYVGEKND